VQIINCPIWDYTRTLTLLCVHFPVPCIVIISHYDVFSDFRARSFASSVCGNKSAIVSHVTNRASTWDPGSPCSARPTSFIMAYTMELYRAPCLYYPAAPAWSQHFMLAPPSSASLRESASQSDTTKTSVSIVDAAMPKRVLIISYPIYPVSYRPWGLSFYSFIVGQCSHLLLFVMFIHTFLFCTGLARHCLIIAVLFALPHSLSLVQRRQQLFKTDFSYCSCLPFYHTNFCIAHCLWFSSLCTPS